MALEHNFEHGQSIWRVLNSWLWRTCRGLAIHSGVNWPTKVSVLLSAKNNDFLEFPRMSFTFHIEQAVTSRFNRAKDFYRVRSTFAHRVQTSRLSPLKVRDYVLEDAVSLIYATPGSLRTFRKKKVRESALLNTEVFTTHHFFFFLVYVWLWLQSSVWPPHIIRIPLYHTWPLTYCWTLSFLRGDVFKLKTEF